ncbi:protein-disulfide reductase DsbD family protein [Roseimaritima ulvae]|uniref:Thiol:disulfide interchange protein DsbD n=1 Tax=Roseimaritima ulvae TaxID=980254 RepID=A0A5B9R6S0_9BACT|nr:cytochrome c biogenesis protein CcdA [Roseimaritima ulvae]QEG42033.1 Thiol:disulfide interchange protein DsbD precursor [Roseimaritima ulvae]
MVLVNLTRRLAAVAALLSVVAMSGVTSAQEPFGNGFTPTFPGAAASGGEPIELEASFEVAEGMQQGRVHVDATLQEMWHVYSVTQPEGGPSRTVLKLADGSPAKLTGSFVPSRDPKRSVSAQFPGVTIEEHEHEIRWTAPIEFAESVDPSQAKLTIDAVGLTCMTDGSCQPFREELQATMAGTYKLAKPDTSFRDGDYAVQWSASLEPRAARPGDVVKLNLTATPDETFHVYPATIDDADFSTNFVLTRRGALQASLPQPSEPPVTVDTPSGDSTYQKGKVTWTIELTVPKDTTAGAYPLEGYIAYQACTDTSCLLPKALQFSTQLEVGSEVDTAAAPVQFSTAKRGQVMDLIAETSWADEQSKVSAPTVYGAGGDKKYSFVMMLLMGLGAGLILNLMPCVLPVLGLKLMSLTDQAGQDHRSVMLSNLWYSLGVLTVFWALAAAASIFSFGWGEQFTYMEFKLALTFLVFAMALSFLGVWEIPVPGFASGKMSQDLQHSEGAVGAYSKGLFTTVIATPCGGPLLGLVLSLLIGQSAAMIFAVFTAMGIGMSLPFLLIGINPKLVSWLPKPGAWMETLKQLMAFVLLGTVAFFFDMFSADYKLPVFVSLIGVWFGCWLIGQVPNWETLPKRLGSWTAGIASAAAIGFLAFRLLVPGEVIVPWQPYDEAKLAQLRSEGKTVMIDFTASWCATCKWNYHTALNTEETAKMMEELDAVPMLADWSDYNEAIKNKLTELESQSIPLLAIYPGSQPDSPIILRDLVNQQDVLGALETAGPSVDANVATRSLGFQPGF